MSEPWQPETGESDVWQSPASDLSHPSFPFVDPLLPPSHALESGGISPPPPPYNLLASESLYPVPAASGQRDIHQTQPIKGTVFGLGIGVGCGVLVALALIGALSLIVLSNLHVFTGKTPSAAGQTLVISSPNTQATKSGQTGGTPGNANGGTPTSSPNAPPGIAGANATATPTLLPGVIPTAIPTLLPGVTPTKTPTDPPPVPTNTPLPAKIPLTVSGYNPNDHRITFTIATQPNALLHITVIGCGQADSTYNNYATTTNSGSYSDTIKLNDGCMQGTVTVTAHLTGYTDTTQSATVSTGG